MFRRLLAGVFLGTIVLGPASAFAQEPPPTVIPEGEEPLPKKRPLPPDNRTLRPTLAMSIAWGRMLGTAEENRPNIDDAAWGPIPGITVGLGVSRHVSIEGFAFFGSFGGGTRVCTTCTARSQLFGGQVSYHLLDGVPFDPWFSAGAGWRTAHYAGNPIDNGASVDFHGIEAMRLALGADEYLGPVGVGAYADFTIGEFMQRTHQVHDDTAVHTSLSFGLRVVAKPF